MATLKTIRSILLVTILLAFGGTFLELVFLGHFEDSLQLIPLGLIVPAVLVLGWYAISRGGAAIRVFQAIMALFMVAGLAGIVLHAQSNIEFAIEMYPNIERMDLLRKTAAGAIPMLAPGAMIQMGLLGFAYTFRHPALKKEETSHESV
jgi:hypothetical protein